MSELLLNVPSLRETSLDDALIHTLIPHGAPIRFGSGAAVRLDIHNIGGLRRVQRWEIGDVALLVYIIRASKVIARKVAILQAKRLYPSAGDVEDDDPVGFAYGMNQMLRREEAPTSLLLECTYRFGEQSRYGALLARSNQQRAIADFEQRFGAASVYYLLYNPHVVPIEIRYPIPRYRRLRSTPKLGARVFAAAVIHRLLDGLEEGRSPTLESIQGIGSPPGGWRLEQWAADELLRCKVGRRFNSPDDAAVLNLLERRSGPIGAAIEISIELPD